MSNSIVSVIQTGGKQHRVKPGDIIQIEKLEGEKGSLLQFGEVLFCSDGNPEAPKIQLGKPMVAGAKVEGEIVGQGRGDKILIIKMKRRKQYRRTKGHRQDYTQVLITSCTDGSGQTASLSAEEKSACLKSFQPHLRPRPQAEAPQSKAAPTEKKPA